MICVPPSLYLSRISSPETPFTVCATVALVMVLLGMRSHGRCPSPVPRIGSGDMWISTAFWLRSACGMPVTPMKEFALISENAGPDDAAHGCIVGQFDLIGGLAV